MRRAPSIRIALVSVSLALSACASDPPTGDGSSSGAGSTGSSGAADSGGAASSSSTGGPIVGPLQGCEGCWSGWCVLDTGACALGLFATQAAFAGDFGGHAFADTQCRTEAASESFAAWLSTGGAAPVVAAEHVMLADDRMYVLRGDDGVVVAESGQALVAGTLMHGIDRFADGTPTPTGADRPAEMACGKREGYTVWTGTNADASPSTATCEGWTCASGGCVEQGQTGDAAVVDSDWTHGCNSPCSQTAAFYCVETP